MNLPNHPSRTRLTILQLSVSRLSKQCGIFNIRQPCGPSRPAIGIALVFCFTFVSHFYRPYRLSEWQRGLRLELCWPVCRYRPRESYRLCTGLRNYSPINKIGNAARKTNASVIGFDVRRAVIMTSSIFWDRTPCSRLKVNLRLGGTSSGVPPSFMLVPSSAGNMGSSG
jgi:hypothetical protein